MGRTKQTKRKKNLHKGEGRAPKKRKHEPQQEGYSEILKENSLYEKYYKGQGLIPEQEWDQFMTTLKEYLPVTFRITGTKVLAKSILACLERRYFSELSGLEVGGEKIQLRPLEWYPDRLAWHISLSRSIIRKSPLLSKFHSFLVKENQQGNLSRQEAVSMIPPLLLGVESHHYVLDMCAAPGSKTAQLIESLHESQEGSIPKGVVIANDADNKRCYMLVHQTKRLNSPCFMVTNHDASCFPLLYYHDKEDVRHPLYYDRVLCDVPCSADGTMRKNPTIWQTWNPGLALSLHRLQLRILVRGLELLSPGGRLVYSTCSLNPIEDEAVICTALKLSKGGVSLVDCSQELQGLKRTCGVSNWKVMSKDGQWLPSGEAAPTSGHMIQSSMFPPSPEEAEDLHLDRCIRVLPHQQNTGGFFVAVLQKTSWLPWQPEAKLAPKTMPSSSETGKECSSEDKKDEQGEEIQEEVAMETEERPVDIIGKPAFLKKKKAGYKEDPFVFLKGDEKIVEHFSGYFGFLDTFPNNQLMTRTQTGKNKTLYLTSYLVKDITQRNEKDCKIINTGVRVLTRCDHPQSSCEFRLTQEGLDTMTPFITRNIVPISLEDLILVLREANPHTSSLSLSAQSAIASLEVGPALFVYTPSTDKSSIVLSADSSTDPSTDNSSNRSTVPSTDAPTDPSIVQSVDPPTDSSSTDPPTDPSIVQSADSSTDPSTDPSAHPSTDPSIVQSADSSTDPSTVQSTDPSTHPSVDPPTESSTDPSTDPSTNPPTDPSTDPSTCTHSSTEPTTNPPTDLSTGSSSISIPLQFPIHLSTWIAAKSVRLFVTHPDRYHYLAVLGETPPENLSLATINKTQEKDLDEEEMEEVAGLEGDGKIEDKMEVTVEKDDKELDNTKTGKEE